jgi:hypothetical protein
VTAEISLCLHFHYSSFGDHVLPNCPQNVPSACIAADCPSPQGSPSALLSFSRCKAHDFVPFVFASWCSAAKFCGGGRVRLGGDRERGCIFLFAISLPRTTYPTPSKIPDRTFCAATSTAACLISASLCVHGSMVFLYQIYISFRIFVGKSGDFTCYLRTPTGGRHAALVTPKTRAT